MKCQFRCLAHLKYWIVVVHIDLWASLVVHSSTLPGKSHGQRSLVGCSPRGHKELDTTERLHFSFTLHALEEDMQTHSSVLAWRIPGRGEPGGLPSIWSQSRTLLKRLSSNSSRSWWLKFNPWVWKIPWRRKWLPTPIFFPGEFLGRGVWWATVHKITKSWTRLSDYFF